MTEKDGKNVKKGLVQYQVSKDNEVEKNDLFQEFQNKRRYTSVQ